MKVSKIGNIMLFLGILSVMVVCAGAAPAQAKSVDVSVQIPTSVTSGQTISAKVVITNNGDSPIKIKRWFYTYVVPNLVYKGPYDIQGPIVEEPPLGPGQFAEKTFSLKISGAKGVAVPVMAFIQGDRSYEEYNPSTNTSYTVWKPESVWGGVAVITVN